MSTVDVIVTVIGGAAAAHAIQDGGGLVGTRSSAEPPAGVDIEFVDWPFLEEDITVQEHVDVVAALRPKYAVAPDVQAGRPLEAVVDVGDELLEHAEIVIVVPKEVRAGAVPERFRLGLPFRDNFETDLGANTFFDFQGRPVHVLGGNPTDQFRVADRFELDVRSVDSPTPIAWASGGRVWVGRARGADEVLDLIEDRNIDPVALEVLGITDPILLRRTFAARLTFSVRNLIDAWADPNHAVELPVRVAPGRGPPPPMDEPIEQFGETLSIEEQRERFREATDLVEIGRVEREAPAETAPATIERFGDNTTASDEEGNPMPVDDGKRRLFQRIQARANDAVERLGLGPGALPDRDDEDE